MRWTLALIAVGFVLLFWGAARADWQVHEWDGREWSPAMTPRGRLATINIEKAACEMDLANLSLFKPAGTKLQCRRVK